GEVLAHEHALPRAGGDDFEPDVERIHRPIYREPRDPVEGREPVPWWLWAAAAVALFWGGWYLGRYGGTLDTRTHIAFPELEAYVAGEAAERRGEALADPVATGAEIYTARCQACHQADGRGVPGVFPPIIGSEWVTGPPELPVLILLNGLEGPIEVAGEAYVGAMPGWRDVLSDAEIAAVATYIRQWETNDAPPVEPERVSTLRAATEGRREPWTVEALEAEGATP
ncbi:MAG: c-type cytochrome, partial [Gemmatimonadota bacterium]